MYTAEFQEIPQSYEQIEGNKTETNITTKITTYLRWIGSLLIILSAISFMVQGHEDILPAYRYWIGLGLTLLLCGGGLVCAYLFNETKGARIFFGLGAAFLPVQVSQVSGMIYSYWHGQAALQPEYSWLQFMDVSPSVIALDFVITGALLLLVSYASYSILARKYLKTLLWTSVAGNIMLMLPVRDATLIPFVIAGLFMLLRSVEHRLHNDSTMRLPEGMAARALMSLPLWIIVGRSLLHPVSFMLGLVLLAIIVVYCIYDIKRYTQTSFLVYVSQWLGTFAAMALWLMVLGQFDADFSNHYCALFPIAIILFVLSKRVDYHARLYRFISSVMILLLNYGAMVEQQTLAPVFSIAVGLLLTVAGMKYREKFPLIIGNICVAGGFLFYWEYAMNLYANTPWISSIILGLVVILLASYIENRSKQIVAKSRHYFNELKSWN